jgi:hypothetical protein
MKLKKIQTKLKINSNEIIENKIYEIKLKQNSSNGFENKNSNQIENKFK